MLAIAIVLTLSVGAVQAQQYYFLQDDLEVDYSVSGDPLAAGTEIWMGGSLVDWNNPGLVVGYFQMFGKATAAASNYGPDPNQWVMNFDDQGAGYYFAIYDTYSPSGGYQVLRWQAKIQEFVVRGYWANPNDAYPAGYPRPSYETQPLTYDNVGYATFAPKTAGDRPYQTVTLDWFGIYNGRYDDTRDVLLGNLQGRLSVVPEPGALAFLVSGAGVAVAAFRRRRR